MYDLSCMPENFKDLQRPGFIYRRVAFATFREPVVITIDPDWLYVLRFIRAKWGQHDSALPPVSFSPDLSLELFADNFNHRQNTPIPLELISTPGNSGVVWVAALTSAAAPRYDVVLDDVYSARGSLTAYITGQNVAGALPPFLDICFCGYYIRSGIKRESLCPK